MSKGNAVRLIPASSIRTRALRFAWKDRIALKVLNLIVGEPGQGKSTLTVELGARLSRGELVGDLEGEPVTVAFATAEDTAEEIVVPRLQAANADLDRVRLIRVSRGGLDGDLVLPNDFRTLRAALVAEDVRVVVIDPVVAHVGGAVNSWKDQQVRAEICAPLARIAEEAQAAIIGIMHLNKATVANALSRVGGSVAWVAAARSVLVVGSDPSDDALHVVAEAKKNIAPYRPSLRMRLEERWVESDEGPVRTSALVWLGEAPGVSANDLVRQPNAEAESPGAADQAEEHLRTLLREGSKMSEALDKELKKVGVSEWAKREAQKRLGVKPYRQGNHWWWKLPEAEDDGAPSHTIRTDILGSEGSHGTRKTSEPRQESARAQDDGRLAPRTDTLLPTDPCPTCRTMSWWQQSGGLWVCGTCHPRPHRHPAAGARHG